MKIKVMMNAIFDIRFQFESDYSNPSIQYSTKSHRQ